MSRRPARASKNGVVMSLPLAGARRSFHPVASSLDAALTSWCRVVPRDGVLAGEAGGHEVGHGEVDHGFGAVRVGFAVTGQAAMEYEPAVGPLDCPAFRGWGESAGAGGALEEFEVDAEGGGILEEVFAVAAVDPDFAQAGMAGGGLVQKSSPGGGVEAGCAGRVAAESGELRPTVNRDVPGRSPGRSRTAPERRRRRDVRPSACPAMQAPNCRDNRGRCSASSGTEPHIKPPSREGRPGSVLADGRVGHFPFPPVSPERLKSRALLSGRLESTEIVQPFL